MDKIEKKKKKKIVYCTLMDMLKWFYTAQPLIS